MEQWLPLHGELVAVGVLGVVLFICVLFSSASCLWPYYSHRLNEFLRYLRNRREDEGDRQSEELRAQREKFDSVNNFLTRVCFHSLSIMAVLELPRYFALAIDGQYTSQSAYFLHILAGEFFFAAFCVVCYQWAGLLHVGQYAKVFYERDALLAAVAVFAVISIISGSICLSSGSLEGFFESKAYRGFTTLEVIKNIVYSSVLNYYGISLVARLWNYSEVEKRESLARNPEAARSTKLEYCLRMVHLAWTMPSMALRTKEESNPDNTNQKAVFTAALIRVTTVLTISSVCFALRLAMLIAKAVALAQDSTITTRSFSLFGLGWFICSDFIPRVIPSLAFVWLMRTKRPSSTESSSEENNCNNDSGVASPRKHGKKNNSTSKKSRGENSGSILETRGVEHIEEGIVMNALQEKE